MGDEVRVTVIAAGFDRWDEGKGRGLPGEGEDRGPDLFGDVDDDEDIEGDDEFDVPSFLK